MGTIAYLKQQCGWSRGVREVLAKYGVEYEERQIHDPVHYQEMILKSGQMMQPTLIIDDKVLSDISGEELQEYLIETGFEQKCVDFNVPLDKPCTEEEHRQQERMKEIHSVPVRDTHFRGF